MNRIRMTSSAIHVGILAISLFLSIVSMCFGESVSPTPEKMNMAQPESLYQQNASGERAHAAGSMGFRSAESEEEGTGETLVPLQRSLSVKKPELVETTDASGGTMIQLQGKFQCGLKVPHEPMDLAVAPSTLLTNP